MALKTINDLTALTTPASTDLVGVWAVGAARMRKSTIAQTFSPMLAVANVFSAKQTMDALLALKKNVAPGTTSGYLELGTDSNGDLKVQNDAGAPRTLAGSISGGGTVATGGYTLTVPATGVAALESESTWIPVLLGSTGNPTATYGIQVGLYQRVGDIVFISFMISTTAISGGSGDLRIGGLPFPHRNTTNLASSCSLVVSELDFSVASTHLVGRLVANQDYILLQQLADTATPTRISVSAWSPTAYIQGSMVYLA